jgi:hypothetical protein
MDTAKANTANKYAGQTIPATGFHVLVNMASCVFVRQNKFRQPKT